MTKTVTGTVVHTTRRGTTMYGNPMYDVALELTAIDGTPAESSVPVTFRMSDNASLAYAINNPEYRDTPHTFRLTPAGRLSGYVKP